MDCKLKITVLTSRFTITGVPLAQMRLARALAKRGHQVELVIGCLESKYDAKDVEGFSVRVFNQRRVRGMLFVLVSYLREAEPDVIFSAEDHLNIAVLIAAILSGSRAKISGSSRIHPMDRMAYSTRVFSKGWFLRELLKTVFWRADALTCVSQDMVLEYRKLFRASPHVCVYNIVKDATAVERSGELLEEEWVEDKECVRIVSAGTLTARKGFSDLIVAFEQVARTRPARLLILGEGELRDSLVSLVDDLGLRGRVCLPGSVTNTLKYFAHSDVFVLSSYSEGLPNVLVEAMMCGCTPVATDCPTGPREVLQGGKYGYLVPMRDPAAMAVAIKQALDKPIPKALLEEAIRPFEEQTVIDRHFEVLGLCEELST